MTLVIGADVSETFIHRDINIGGDGQSLLITIPFGWAIFGNNRNAELDVQGKITVNTTLTKDTELNEDLKKFWEYDSKIGLTGSKVDLPQNDMECLKKLDESSVLVNESIKSQCYGHQKISGYQITTTWHLEVSMF